MLPREFTRFYFKVVEKKGRAEIFLKSQDGLRKNAQNIAQENYWSQEHKSAQGFPGAKYEDIYISILKKSPKAILGKLVEEFKEEFLWMDSCMSP